MQVISRVLCVVLLAMAAVPVARPAAATDWGRLDAAATGRAVPGPAGWLNWCFAEMERCAPAGPGRPLAATPELLDLLEAVQGEVNRAIAPRAEPAGQDLWQLGARSGDCEDYALAKQQRLLAAGLPRGTVRLATASLADGERHAVLVVETERGTLVLDNLQPHVVPLRALPYTWHSAQGTDASLLWRELAPGAPAQPVTAGMSGGDETQGTGKVAQ